MIAGEGEVGIVPKQHSKLKGGRFMKSIFLSFLLVLVLAFSAFAQVDIDGPHHTLGIGSNAQAGATSSASAGASSSSSSGVINNIGNGFGNFSPSARSTLDFDYRSFDFQSQFGYVAPVQTVTVEVPRELLPVPEMPAQINPLIQGGIGHYALLPKLAKVKRLGDGEAVIRVLESYNGWFLNRICIEDVTEFVIKEGTKLITKKNGYIVPPAKLRFQVYYKNKVKASGTSGGLNAVVSGLNGGTNAGQGGGAGSQILPGYNSSWADPTLTVEFYEIE